MRILALFDDGFQSVKKALPDDDVVSVGINNADVIMDLSDMNNLEILIKLHNEKPFDLIFATPPCESWSFSTASTGGNAYRFSDNLKLKNFEEWKANNYNNVKSQVLKNKNLAVKYQRYYKTGVNGEMTALFTAEIVKALNIPFVIENPYSSIIWRFFEKQGIKFHKNKACYSCYDSERNLKPTGFGSSKRLTLKTAKKAAVTMAQLKGTGGDGGLRSIIPNLLVIDIVSRFKTY